MSHQTVSTHSLVTAKSYSMNMCSDQHGVLGQGLLVPQTTQPGTRDSRMSAFLGFIAATSEAMGPW